MVSKYCTCAQNRGPGTHHLIARIRAIWPFGRCLGPPFTRAGGYDDVSLEQTPANYGFECKPDGIQTHRANLLVAF